MVFFVLNLFIWGQKSSGGYLSSFALGPLGLGFCWQSVNSHSGAVPFTTMFAILVLWFGISASSPVTAEICDCGAGEVLDHRS